MYYNVYDEIKVLLEIFKEWYDSKNVVLESVVYKLYTFSKLNCFRYCKDDIIKEHELAASSVKDIFDECIKLEKVLSNLEELSLTILQSENTSEDKLKEKQELLDKYKRENQEYNEIMCKMSIYKIGTNPSTEQLFKDYEEGHIKKRQLILFNNYIQALNNNPVHLEQKLKQIKK